MSTGFAVRVVTDEPVAHLVGLAVRAERLGACAVLVGVGGSGRDVAVAVAAMAVATDRVALLPIVTATSPAAVRRAAPTLASLAELSDGRVVGCVPAAALRGADDLGVPVAAVSRRGRPVEGVAGVVAEGDRPAPVDGGWSLWCPPGVPDDLDPTGLDAIGFTLARHDGDELDAIAAGAVARGLDPYHPPLCASGSSSPSPSW